MKYPYSANVKKEIGMIAGRQGALHPDCALSAVVMLD
jgi:hypothetical protein